MDTLRRCGGRPCSRIPSRALGRIPEHWTRFTCRRSTLSEGNRKAIDQPNALHNYLFAILEAELKLTAMEVGLDPHLGILHADLAFPPSLAADLMEPFRPHVGRQVLEFLERREFSEREFFETRQGQGRPVSPLTSEVTDTLYSEIPDVRKIVTRVRGRLLR